tara:strand:- start:138 stop:884 length:747 start_codon:yes stop_codon:yes gene_type:complete
MAKKSGLGQELYIHGYDLSGDVGSLDSVGSPREQLEVTAINKSARERIFGLSDGSLSFNSFFNDATGQEHAALSGLPTADRIICWNMGGTRGDASYCLTAKQVNYDGSRGTDGSLAFTVGAVANGIAPDWCQTLTSGQETHGSAGSSTSRDDSAATSAGLIAYLEIVDCDSGTPTVTIQQSSDNGSGDAWATVLSFTAVGYASAPTAERVTVSGAVERYLRVTTTGTFSNLDFVVTTRRGTAQDDVTL